MENRRENAALILDDGTVFYGKQLGHLDEKGRIGEIVFNTSMSGYQEIITDPSYKGQMVCFTYPSIGNYGVNLEDSESERPYLEGIIVRDYCDIPSNFRSIMTLEQYLIEHGLAGITGIDTRALVRHIRQEGAMKAGIFRGNFQNSPDLVKKALEKILLAPSMEGQNLASGFDGKAANGYIEKYTAEHNIKTVDFPKVCVLDFGIKYSILKQLLEAGVMPVVFPGDQAMETWQNYSAEDYSGYFLSNGPGDPACVRQGIENIRKIVSLKKPILGICLGHQMLSLALGAETYKLKFGHHGGNQPVRRENSHRVHITAQNHGFAVKKDFFGGDFIKTNKGVCEINPNDLTVEGFYVPEKNILSVQYHPEAGPGPNDATYIFKEFRKMILP